MVIHIKHLLVKANSVGGRVSRGGDKEGLVHLSRSTTEVARLILTKAQVAGLKMTKIIIIKGALTPPV